MITMYFGYEVAHRRTHTHPPRNEFGRWMRRSHLHHHFGAPMRNFGVTSPVWDRLLGTYDDPGVVTVPERMAPVWMVDQDGHVRPEFSADYIVKAGRRRDRRPGRSGPRRRLRQRRPGTLSSNQGLARR